MFRPYRVLLGGVLGRYARLFFRISLDFLMRAKLLDGRSQMFLMYGPCRQFLFSVFVLLYANLIVVYFFEKSKSFF